MAKPLTLEAFTAELAAAVGSRLVCFLLYGSAARGAVPSGGAIDTLLICDAVDEPLYASLEPVVRRWVAAGHPAPLVVTASEWRESADVFAIEYADMHQSHRVLAGSDPWAGITVDRAHVRHQLEQELRGKVVRLRQGYVAARSDGHALGDLVRGTAGGWLTMLRTALRLADRAVPDDPAGLVRAGADLAGFAAEPVATLVAAARGPGAPQLVARDPRAAAYLAAVARTAEYVNSL